MQQEPPQSNQGQQNPEMEKRWIIWVPIGKGPLTTSEYELFQKQLIANVSPNEMAVRTKWR
jgi:hypothetical protein